MSHDPLALAYMAGVIDSDGYITIHRSTRRGRSYFAPQIGVAGTRRQPHDLATSLWGGNVNAYTPKNPRHRIQFQWQRTGASAASAIDDLLPFLRVKEEQAWLALEAWELVVGGKGPDPYPWQLPDYDPTPGLHALREDMVHVLNQGRRIEATHAI